MTVIARPTARRNAKARSSVRQCKASQFEDHADKWSEYRRHLMLPTPVVEANQVRLMEQLHNVRPQEP